jgi:glutamine amidotransferase
MGNVVRQGLLPFLREYLASDRPFLGICVGMQLLFSGSEEFGRHEGIDFFPGNVIRFPGDMPARDGGVLKVPHMGWNEVEVVGDPPAFRGIPSGTYFYFVHSYYAAPKVPGDVVCRSAYGVPFAAAVSRGNRLAVQFHPEKSQTAGLRLLGNFGRLCAEAA